MNKKYMKQAFNSLWFLLLGCLWITSCIDDDPEEGTIQLKAGDSLPVFSVRMDNGQTVTPESLKGKTAIIIFFNTGCQDCQHELPVLQRVYVAYPQVNWVCISREENAESIQKFWTEQSITLPYSAQKDREVYYQFAKSGIPQVFIVDKNSTIRKVFSDSPVATYEELTAAIEVVN